jgi:DNA-binding transcriptional MerR regulator
MKDISIRQLEELSHIKAHTIRIWENRFQLFKPGRSSGNIRYYSIDDLKKLLDIAFLNRAGIRISRLAVMQDAEIKRLLDSYPDKEAQISIAMNRLVTTMFSGNIEEFENTLNHYQAEFGLDILIREIIIPFLEKVNLFSYKDRSNETHLVVTAIRRKIITGIEHQPRLPTESKSALLFLPEGEHFDLILLYVCYLLKSIGMKVLYLGTNVPQTNIEKLALSRNPDYLYVYHPPKKKYIIDGLSEIIGKSLPGSKLYVVNAPGPSSEKNRPDNVRFINFNEVFTSLEYE